MRIRSMRIRVMVDFGMYTVETLKSAILNLNNFRYNESIRAKFGLNDRFYFIFYISFMGWVKLAYGTVVVLPI